MKVIILILLSTVFNAYAIENSLVNFETDGCTLFVNGTKQNPELWKDCCTKHDIRYWFGGDKNDLDNADLNLKKCVNDLAGSKWAELIYIGVRTGHMSPIKNKEHWGWGWKNPRKNDPLSLDESKYIIQELRRLPFDMQFIESFINDYFPQKK